MSQVRRTALTRLVLTWLGINAWNHASSASPGDSGQLTARCVPSGPGVDELQPEERPWWSHLQTNRNKQWSGTDLDCRVSTSSLYPVPVVTQHSAAPRGGHGQTTMTFQTSRAAGDKVRIKNSGWVSGHVVLNSCQEPAEGTCWSFLFVCLFDVSEAKCCDFTHRLGSSEPLDDSRPHQKGEKTGQINSKIENQ